MDKIMPCWECKYWLDFGACSKKMISCPDKDYELSCGGVLFEPLTQEENEKKLEGNND